MKSTWLFSACCFWIICILPVEISWWCLPFLMLFLFHRQNKWCICSLVLLLSHLIFTNVQVPEVPKQIKEVHIEEIKTNYVIADMGEQHVLLYGMEDPGLDSVWQVEGTCRKIDGNKNFGLFDFSAYMNRRSIYYGCQVSQASEVVRGNSFRAHIWQKVQKMEEEQRAWLNMMLYGIQEDEQHTYELASSSGMHLSMLAQWLKAVLSLWVSPYLAEVCSLAGIVLLGSLTTFRDAIFRIFCFRLIGIMLPKASVYDKLGIGMIGCLWFRPYLASEITFLLPVLFRLCAIFNTRKRKRKIVSLLVLIPIQFYYFHEVDLIQLLLFSVSRILYAIIYGCAILYLLCPCDILFMIANTMLACIQCFSQFQLSLFYQASSLFLLLWFSLCFHYIGRCRNSDLFLLSIMFLYTQCAPYLQPYLEVMMIDVGQGDCLLISLPFHQGNILIDVAGSQDRDLAKDIIVPVLQAKGIRTLDLVIITHDDFDHSGGLASLQEQMNIKKVITEKQESISFGNFQFQFLLADTSFSDINENSIITYMEAFHTRFLFMGDAGKVAESEILKRYPELQADIVKIGHHGSNTASAPAFIHQLHPALALISCGAHNFYGHPSPQTIQTLQQEEVTILDTPAYGAISLKFTNILCFYKTATHEFGIILPGDK